MKLGNPLPGDIFALFIFRPNESLEGRIVLRSPKSFGHIGLEHGASAAVAHLFYRSHLFRRPSIQVHRFDFGDVDAQISVDSRAANAEEDAKIPRSPSRTFGIAVDAVLVILVPQQIA